MSRWKRLAGDTNGFAFEVSFHDDPHGGVGATAEDAASWGAFQVWVEGANLCAHREDGERLDSVHWYLLPMIEWFATNWDALFHEERLPSANRGATAAESLAETLVPMAGLLPEAEERWQLEWSDWWSRHGLLAARDGGLFPSVYLRRWRDRVELSWAAEPAAGMPNHYQFDHGAGAARLHPLQVAEPLHQVLCEAAKYLAERCPESERLKALLANLGALRDRDRGRRLALLAGLGVDLWAKASERLQRSGTALANCVAAQPGDGLVVIGHCQAALMFGSVSPTVGEADVLALADALVRQFSPGAESPALTELVRPEPLTHAEPWQQGYELAEGVLEELELPRAAEPAVDVAAVLTRLGIQTGELELTDRDLRAVAIAGPDHVPSVLLNRTHPTANGDAGRRFTLAHELCHLLHDRDRGVPLAMVSGPWAPVDLEQRANAFAAMLLMPPDLIWRTIRACSEDVASADGVRAVARQLRTSPTATLEHLTNLAFVDQAANEVIRNEWADGQRGR